MKRVGLFLAAAMGLAASASASVLVIQEADQATGGQPQNYQWQAMQVLGVLESHGVTYRLVPHGAVTTAGARAGQITNSLGTETYDAVIHLGYDASKNPINSTIYDPRTYLRSATWPTVPHLWIFAPYTGGLTSNTATDTTGCSDFYGSGQALVGSLYTTGHPWTWKNMYATPKPTVATATRAAGVWRALVSYGVTWASEGGVMSSGARRAVKNPDSLLTRSDNPDSVIVWYRGRAANDPDGQVFCYAGGGGLQDLPSIKVALAMLDSITAISNGGQGKVFDNRGKTTRRHGLAVAAANRHGSPLVYNVPEGGGIYCPSLVAGDTCDRSNFAGGVDSINSLRDINGRRIRGTWLVDPESLTTTNGALLLAQLKRAGEWKFGLQPISGAVANTTTRAGAAGRCIDPMGETRRRSIFPTTPSFTSPSCATDSGSVQCNVKNGFDALASAVGASRVDHVLAPSSWDWSPQEWTSNGAGTVTSGNLWGGEDSLRAALYSAGVRALLVNPVATNGNVGISFATSGSVQGGTDPAGWSPVTASLGVRWGGARRGRIAMLGTRFETSAASWTWRQEAHPGIGDEFLGGSDAGQYFIGSLVYYHHTFNVGTRVFAVQAGMLGGPRGDPWPQRPGFWQIKWLQHGFNAAHAFLPRWSDGSRKLLDEFDYCENIEP